MKVRIVLPSRPAGSVQMMAGALAYAAVAAATAPAAAHGTHVRVLGSPSITVEFRADDGSAVSFAEADIRPPEGSGLTPTTGRTDRQGRLVLEPTHDGLWLLEMDAGDDQVARTSVRVEGGFAVAAEELVPRWLVAGSLALNVAAAGLIAGRGFRRQAPA
jgi:hypothetical protein